MLRVRLLGALALELDGHSLVAPSSRPTRALLAWLALHPGLHARSRLAGRLWPHVLDESARASLRKALADLRRALGEEGLDALVTTRQEVGLSSRVWVDLRAFGELLASGRLEEAVELCRGELLPGLDDDWAYEARDEHEARLAVALARLGDVADQAGDLETAVRRSRELIAVEPLSEEAHRALIRRLGAAGDRPAALAAYARLRERLRRELGVAPSPETRALVEHLRRGDTVGEPETPAAIHPPLPPPLALRRRTAFVGRTGELVRLREAWDAASRGEVKAVLVGGEPGIGKTRLAAEFAHSAHAAGATVLLGRCYEEPLIAYQPFVEAFRPLLSTKEGELGELRPLVPGLVDADAEPAPTAGGPDVARFRLFESVNEALASASRQRPVLLVLEDLHWADAPTLLLVAHVVRAPEPARLLIVSTYRDSDLAPDHPVSALLADLRRERLGERVVLRGLGEPEVAELIAASLGADSSPMLAEQMHRETGGNPFFVEEILRHVEEAGMLTRGGRWDIAELGVPEGVKEVIGRRVERLGKEAGKSLSFASVLGREFSLEELARLVDDVAEERLVDALEEGLRASLIREERERPGRYSFAHSLVREALYDGLTASRRRQLHLLAAEALEQLYGDRPDRLGELAHHLFQSATPATAHRAADYAERAGELALAQLAYEEAAAQFDRALTALDLLDRPAGLRRAELLLALGDARMRAGDRDGGRRAFSRAAAAARALDRPDLLARAALGFGGIGVTITVADPAVVGLLEEALGSSAANDEGLRARLLARLAVEIHRAAPDRGESLSEEAIAIARACGDARALAEALSARHVARWGPDHVAERAAIADEMTALARSAGDRAVELQGHHWRVVDLFQLGDRRALERELDAYAGIAGEVRLPVYEWYLPMWRATLAMLDGPLDEAKRLWSEALALGRRAQDANAELFFRIVDRYYLPLEEGRADEADLEFQRAGIRRPEIDWAYRTGAARILAERGRVGEARAEFDILAADGFAAIPRDIHFLAGLAEFAIICSLLDDVPRAALVYDLYVPYRKLNITQPRAFYCYGWAEHYLGLLAATLSRWPAAVEHYGIALEHERRWGARRQLCRTLCAYAEMLLARADVGDRNRARALAAEALETAEQLHAPNLLARAKAVTREASAAQPA